MTTRRAPVPARSIPAPRQWWMGLDSFVGFDGSKKKKTSAKKNSWKQQRDTGLLERQQTWRPESSSELITSIIVPHQPPIGDIALGRKWETAELISSRAAFGTFHNRTVIGIDGDCLAFVGGVFDDGDPFDNKTWDSTTCIDLFKMTEANQLVFVKRCAMKKRRTGCAAIAKHNRLYIFGGCSFNSKKANCAMETSCEVVDLDTNESRKLPNLPGCQLGKPGSPGSRKWANALWYDDTNIVLVGGSNRSSLDVFDTVREEWNNGQVEFPAMPKRYDGAAGIVESSRTIVLAGGTETVKRLSLSGKPTEEHRPVANILNDQNRKWEAVAKMNTNRHAAGGSVFGPSDSAGDSNNPPSSLPKWKMFVAGGKDISGKPLSSVEMYDSKMDSWSPLPSMQDISGPCQLVMTKDRLVAVGNYHNDVEYLILSTDFMSNEFFYHRLELLPRVREDMVPAELVFLASRMGQLSQLQLFYTMVQHLYSTGAITKEQRQKIAHAALEQCAKHCISPEHGAFYKMALKKATNDGILSEQDLYTLEYKAIVKTVENASFIKELQHRVQGLERKMDTVCETLQQFNQAKQKQKPIEVGVMVVSTILSTLAMGVVGLAVEELLLGNSIVQIVDFGDLDHVRDVIHCASNDNDAGWVSETFEMGLDIAQEHEGDELLGDLLKHKIEMLQKNTKKGERWEDKRMAMLLGAAVGVAIASSSENSETIEEPTEEPEFVINPNETITKLGELSGATNKAEDVTEETEESTTLADGFDDNNDARFAQELADDDFELRLFVAIYSGRMKVLVNALRGDPDVNQVDSLGRTPADFAAIMGETEMVTLLGHWGGEFRLGPEEEMTRLASAREAAKNMNKK